jgi:hypothetical protein
MVRITDVLEKQSEKGSFAVLELTGELEMAQSQTTGSFYATQRKCTVPCTMEFEVAKGLIGKEIPGSIIRVECEPYEMMDSTTNEVKTMVYRWEYVPQEPMAKKDLAMVNQSSTLV